MKTQKNQGKTSLQNESNPCEAATLVSDVALDAVERQRLTRNASNRRGYARRKQRYPGYEAFRKKQWRRKNPGAYLCELEKNRQRAAAKRNG
jgi:hypothetical protein